MELGRSKIGRKRRIFLVSISIVELKEKWNFFILIFFPAWNSINMLMGSEGNGKGLGEGKLKLRRQKNTCWSVGDDDSVVFFFFSKGGGRECCGKRKIRGGDGGIGSCWSKRRYNALWRGRRRGERANKSSGVM